MNGSSKQKFEIANLFKIKLVCIIVITDLEKNVIFILITTENMLLSWFYQENSFRFP